MIMNKKHFTAGILALFLVFSTASCAFLEGLFQDTVVTTIDNVKPDQRHTIVPADFGLLDEATREKFRKSGKTPVIVDKSAVINVLDAVDLTDPGDGMFESLAGLGLDLASTVFPGVAALEGVGLLLSRRKRKHYGKAVKAVVPANGKVELKDAILSLGSAIGVAHSSAQSKNAFEEEEPKKSETA